MNEGDIVIVCSQFGEIVDCRLARDRETGKSRGFAFVAYEDQRSTIVAVDNLNGTTLCGRQIMVDHVKQYKIPREYFQVDSDESEGEDDEERWKQKVYQPTGPDGRGWGDNRKMSGKE